ncbi:hypothetical protein IP84_12715 [beta proteobacterium AAP99]|nr:hypothetical protein IP84_12715 [beta proteobacterium AAP99]
MNALHANVAVVGVGMMTPLGYNATTSLAALRAGVSALQELPWLDPDSGEPLRGTRVHLPHWWFGTGMLADLLAPSLLECFQSCDLDPRTIPVLIGVSRRDRPGRPIDLDDQLIPAIESRLGHRLHPSSQLVAGDQFGPAYATAIAAQWLEKREVQRVIVAGVDSFLCTETLDALMAAQRLVTASNINGLFPGESACAVLLALPGSAPDEIVIEGLALTKEESTIESDRAFRAEGLTQAYRLALEQTHCTLSEIDYCLSDLSGEHYKFKEAMFVAGRLDTKPRAKRMELWHPIEFLGEVCAAVLPCLLAQARHAAQQGYAPGQRAICHLGADSGERAALVVRAYQIAEEFV